MLQNSNTITTTQTILGGAAAVLIYSLFRKGSAAQTLNFYPAGVRDIQFDGVTPVMKINLAVQNTSNQDFTLKSLAGSLYANDYLVGNVSQFTPVTIRRNAQTNISVNVRLSLIGIVQDIIKAFQYGSFRQELEFESYANVDNLQIPIDIKYTVG